MKMNKRKEILFLWYTFKREYVGDIGDDGLEVQNSQTGIDSLVSF
jgi:hypothetical protein